MMQLTPFLALALSVLNGAAGYDVPPRPQVVPFPKTPTKAFPVSPARDSSLVCVVPVCSNTNDAAPAILKAIKRCNNGGTVIFPAGRTYTIASPLDLTFLKHIDIFILGTIKFKDDVYYWQDKFFAYTYQGMNLMWRFGGEDVNIFGLGQGTIDGQGQTWWTESVINSTIIRPLLFGTDGLAGGSITGLHMVNPPNWFNVLANSSDIFVTDMNLTVHSTNATYPAKNTDGWDTYRSDNIVIQNSNIDNTDDCVSFKPNSTNIVVQGLVCNGSHGISVGSLAQYVGEVDIVENLYIYNTSMSNAGDGARIKVWPGAVPGSNKTDSGGGSGYARNITYEMYKIASVDYSIELTQCYEASSQANCNAYPSSLVIEDVVFKDFWGVTSKKYDPKVGTLICSSPTVCKNIQAHNISITPPSGKTATWACTNMDNSLLDINCVAS